MFLCGIFARESASELRIPKPVPKRQKANTSLRKLGKTRNVT